MANILKTTGLGRQIDSQIRESAAAVGNALNLLPGLIKTNFGLPIIEAGSNTENLVFPSYIKNEVDSITNLIEFESTDKTGNGTIIKKIWFPCPSNITFNDSATFSTINLGGIGGALKKAVEEEGGGGFNRETVSKIVDNILTQKEAASASFNGIEKMGAALQAVPDGGLFQELGSFVGKTIINPNTNATFTGNPIRSFNFTFKLVADSWQESETVRQIHERFRQYTYATSRTDEQGTILSFPPTWKIRFLNSDMQENPYIPRIFPCYLTGLESSFNSTANMFHGDGAPIEVDISLSFQETRALTREDISSLESRKPRESQTPVIPSDSSED